LLLDAFALATTLAAGFVHAVPQPAPDLPPAVYQARREKLMKELGGCAAVIAAKGIAQGITEDYWQDSDFFYLTGLNEPGAWLELVPKDKYRRTRLYLRSRDPELERWTGPREPLSPELKEKFGVDWVGRGRPGLVQSAQHSGCVALIAPLDGAKDDRPDLELSRQAAAAAGVSTAWKRKAIEALREAHGPEEIARMERAIALTKAGHDAAAKATLAGVSERDVQTQLEYAFFSGGATRLSYPSIVGSGENGAVLHWDQNSRMLRAGDLVVVDAAAEYGRYSADVTRTFPVNGKFNDEQAKVYRAVYQVQEDVFAAIKPGVSMEDLQHVAEESMKRLGYLDKFIHGLGHFVGLEVHDAGDYSAPLPVGAIFTVEPGIYWPEHGFGVRIEDEVLITESGYRLLTKDIPRKLEDVEAWVERARK
jgi:Xaa-Pro aminopeptidase